MVHSAETNEESKSGIWNWRRSSVAALYTGPGIWSPIRLSQQKYRLGGKHYQFNLGSFSLPLQQVALCFTSPVSQSGSMTSSGVASGKD